MFWVGVSVGGRKKSFWNGGGVGGRKLCGGEIFVIIKIGLEKFWGFMFGDFILKVGKKFFLLFLIEVNKV